MHDQRSRPVPGMVHFAPHLLCGMQAFLHGDLPPSLPEMMLTAKTAVS